MGEDFSEEFTNNDLRELQLLMQQAVLHSYPNPERTGCPGFRVLEEVAAAPAPFKHPAYEHVIHCSPCLREMLELRGEKIKAARQTLEVQKAPGDSTAGQHISPEHVIRRPRKLVVWMAAFAVAAMAVTALLIFRTEKSGISGVQNKTIPKVTNAAKESGGQDLPAPEPAIIRLDFRSLALQRGTGQPSEHAAWQIPRKLVTLDIILPFGSDAGQYLVALQAGGKTVVKKIVGTAKIQDGDTLLRVIGFDLSNIPPGNYVLLFRHADAHWRRATIVIE